MVESVLRAFYLGKNFYMLFFGRKLIKIASNQIREKDFRWVPYFVMCTICQIYLSLTLIQRFIHDIYQMGTIKKRYICLL